MIALISTALGQDLAGGDLPFNCKPNPVNGLVVNDTKRAARQRNQQLYGAVGFVERNLFPQLEERPHATAFELNTLQGVGYVPTINRGCFGNPPFDQVPAGWAGGAVMHRVDLFSSSIGAAFGWGPFSLWYATSITGHQYADRWKSYLIPYSMAAQSVLMGYLGPFAPLLIRNDTDNTEVRSRSIDFFIGGDLKIDPIMNARIAYVGTTGFYANVTGKIVRFSGSVGYRPTSEEEKKQGSKAEADPLDYLKGGIIDQQSPKNPLAGRYSAFVRKQEFSPVGPQGIGGASVDFWTAHGNARSLGGWVDIDVAYSYAPTPLLHQLHIGIHTPGFWYARDVANKRRGFDDVPVEYVLGVPLHLGIFGGTTRLPDIYYYGLGETPRIFWRAEALFAMGEDDVGGMVGVRFSYNDADTLAQFPYAYDAMHFNLLVAVNFGKKKDEATAEE